MNAILNIVTAVVNADKLGGWTRSIVAVAGGWAAAHFHGEIGAIFADPTFSESLGVVVSTLAVAMWSQFAKAKAEPKA